MNNKAKLYVFEKKEIALIFVFMLLIAATAFMLGVRIGKNYSFHVAGITHEDRQRVKLLSEDEEKVRDIVESHSTQEVDVDDFNQQMHESLQKRIQEQLEKSENENSRSERVESSSALERSLLEDRELQERELEDTASQRHASIYTGKFTIQLGSYRKLSDAEDFARGFAVRGYDPIINEVDIPGRGTWYRVSLGVFDNSSQARSYIQNERELFQGQEYVIGRFD